MLSGLALNALTLFLTRMGAGITKSNQFAVQAPLLADQYPIQARGRVFAGIQLAGSAAQTLSPLLVGGIAVLAGGSAGWRWAFLLLAIPAGVVALAAFRLPEPPRGQYEKQDVLGTVVEEDAPARISMEAAFSRLLQINTLRSTIVAFAAMGFGLFTAPVLASLFLEEQYGLGSFGRGAVATVGGVAVLARVAVRGPGLRPDVSAGPGQRRCGSSASSCSRPRRSRRSSTSCRTPGSSPSSPSPARCC